MSQKTKCKNCNQMFANSSMRKHYDFCIKNNSLPLITEIDKQIELQYEKIEKLIESLHTERLALQCMKNIKKDL